MKPKSARRLLLCIGACGLLLRAIAAPAEPVLLISVDGLKPEYVLDADAHGLKIPYLRSQVALGTYASGVLGVWPTITYPSHTTLVTGVTPAEHGILANLEFDPELYFKDDWYWYSQQIRTSTLWDVVHKARLVTASVGWPVTVGNTRIDYLIPEYWRTLGATENLNASDRNLIGALSRPDGLLSDMQKTDGDYMSGNDTSLAGDLIKTKYAIDILRRHKPYFMTVHLSSLDDAQHAHGVFSAEAQRVLEQLDGQLAALAGAARESNQSSVVAVVSDHGFMNLTHLVHLNVAFQEAGLLDQSHHSWRAQAWLASGMAAIMLRNKDDQATALTVANLVHALAADPANGIAAVKNRDEINKLGAFPDAAFLIVFKPGYYAANDSAGELITAINDSRGGHGFSPDYPEMRASFFISGKGIAHGRNLGLIDMRQIAPTLAQRLGVTLPTAESALLIMGAN